MKYTLDMWLKKIYDLWLTPAQDVLSFIPHDKINSPALISSFTSLKKCANKHHDAEDENWPPHLSTFTTSLCLHEGFSNQDQEVLVLITE